jgi:flagellar biosynthesis/type III secretory pathway protein FliH
LTDSNEARERKTGKKKKGRKGKKKGGREEGRQKEGRKEGKKEGRKEGRKEGTETTNNSMMGLKPSKQMNATLLLYYNIQDLAM